MFERYTEKARRVIFFARYEASQFGSPYIETEHMLLGLLREDKALTNRFLRSHGAVESIRKQIEAHTTIREKTSTSVDLPLSDECKRLMAYAAEEAERLGHKHIGTEHLLLGLLREEKCFAAEMLRERGIQLDTLREELSKIASEAPMGAGISRSEAQPASRALKDLTQAALDGSLEPLIGREEELECVIEVLSNRHKRHALLIGEHGVGKSAIVEGLAQRISEGKVPTCLQGKVVFAIEPILLASQAMAEAAIKVLGGKPQPEDLILFIGGHEGLLTATAHRGSRGVAGVILFAIQAGVQCIGTGSAKEYELARETMPLIDEWFRAVHVRPLDESETLRVLEARKGQLESFHDVSYSDEAVAFAAQWAGGDLPGSSLPGKALELLDAAGTLVKLRQVADSEIAEIGKRFKFIASKEEDALANHEFEKARFYSDEKRKEWENLQAVREKHGLKETTANVHRGDLELVIARWAEYPYGQ